jgi:tape measure domain-containing protein
MQGLAGEFKKLSEADGAAIKKTFADTQAAAEKAAASMKLFGASSGELRQIQAQVKAAAVDLVTRGLNPESEEVKKLTEEYKRLGKEADGAAIKKTFADTQAAAEKAAASMKLFGASSGELRQTQAQVKAAAVDLVTRGLNPESEEVKKLTEEYKRLGKEAEDLDTATGKNIDSFSGLAGALRSLAEVAALTKALDMIKDMGAFALSTADTFQTARNEFGALLGDMQAGAGLFNEIKAFNDKTPFFLDTLIQATKVLLSAKVPLGDMQNQLRKFGDLSQGNSQKFTSYIQAFSKAAAKGKADMETLNTYANQGVPILDALAERFNVTKAEITEMSSQGKISFEDLSAALSDLTAEGGQYFGGMEQGSRSLAAMQEGLREAVNTLAASFGEMLLPAATAVVKALTDIANAINESPLLKGVLTGALVAITGLLAAMAVKAGIAFAAQMSLNFALGALFPVVLGATLAVAGLAAGYTVYASIQQKATREAEDFALEQRYQKEAIEGTTAALRGYSQALAGMSDADLERSTMFIQRDIDAIEAGLVELEAAACRAAEQGREAMAAYWSDIVEQERGNLDRAREDLVATLEEFGQRRGKWIDSMFGSTQAGKIEKINEQLKTAQRLLSSLGVTDEEKIKLNQIISLLSGDLERLTQQADTSAQAMNDAAARWKESWADVWRQFQAEQSDNPFALINLEEEKRKADAAKSFVQGITANSQNRAILDNEVAPYYAAQREKIARELKEKEERLYRELTETRVDDLEYEMREALDNINTLEARRVIAAAGSEEEITAIRERAAAMRTATEERYAREIAGALAEETERAAEESANATKKRLETARNDIADWQQTLADTLSLALMDIGGFSDQAAVALGELAAQLAGLAANASLDIFEEFGRAMALATDEEYSFGQAMAEIGQQILRQLPMLFLQAGLQLVATPGMWPLGLGLIAAAGATALISGYVDGSITKAKNDAEENARGNVYEYGRAAREYASGGAFTNRIVSQPTYFRYGGGLGVMGEAGPEAIMPLTRGGDGKLGVNAAGMSGTAVYVIIQNYTNEEVTTEESSDSSGNQIHKIIIGTVKDSITSGEMDRPMSSRYGLRARGV